MLMIGWESPFCLKGLIITCFIVCVTFQVRNQGKKAYSGIRTKIGDIKKVRFSTYFPQMELLYPQINHINLISIQCAA